MCKSYLSFYSSDLGFYEFIYVIHLSLCLVLLSENFPIFLQKMKEKLKCLVGNAQNKPLIRVCSLHVPSPLSPQPWVGRKAKLSYFLLAKIRSGKNEGFRLVAILLMCFSSVFLLLVPEATERDMSSLQNACLHFPDFAG